MRYWYEVSRRPTATMHSKPSSLDTQQQQQLTVFRSAAEFAPELRFLPICFLCHVNSESLFTTCVLFTFFSHDCHYVMLANPFLNLRNVFIFFFSFTDEHLYISRVTKVPKSEIFDMNASAMFCIQSIATNPPILRPPILPFLGHPSAHSHFHSLAKYCLLIPSCSFHQIHA